MSIHVLQLGPYPPPEGGVSRNMLAIRDELVNRGNKCSIIATTRSTTISHVPDVYHPRSVSKVLALLRSIDFDVLHLHIGGEVSRRMLGLAAVATHFARKQSVLTIHSGAFPQTASAKAANPFSVSGAIFRRFGRIIVVNDDLRDVFVRFGVNREKVKKILPFSLQTPDETIAVPPHLADFIERHSPVMLAVGGLEKDYDPIFQIDSMRAILKEFPNAGLLLVGDGSMRSVVESAVAATGYADHICIAGNVEHAVTLHLIDRTDILLRTTLFDGDAISVREALFLGTPVIATDNAMRPEGTNLIAIGDELALVRKVSELASVKQQRPDDLAADDRHIKQVIELYEDLL